MSNKSFFFFWILAIGHLIHVSHSFLHSFDDDDDDDRVDWQHILNDVGDELNLLREDIQMRNKRLQSGGDVAKLNATIRKALQHVERDLIDLKDALSDFRHELYVDQYVCMLCHECVGNTLLR